MHYKHYDKKKLDFQICLKNLFITEKSNAAIRNERKKLKYNYKRKHN